MKKILFSCSLVFIYSIVSAQDFLNPYENGKYVGVAYSTDLKYIHGNFEWNAYKNGATGAAFQGYSGEYEIFLRRHIWYEFPYSTAAANPFNDLKKTFIIETVSFPFTPDFTGSLASMYQGGFATDQGLNDRVFKMPADAYNNSYEGWTPTIPHPIYNEIEGLKRISPSGYSDITGGQSVYNKEHSYQETGRHSTLASATVANDFPWQFNIRVFYPHSVHKITVILYCSDDPQEDKIVSSFSFIQDNTRGRMRYYPFENQNNGSDEGTHDVLFAPELVFDEVENNYDEFDNTFMFPDGGTLNYFPFNNITSDCGNNQFIPLVASEPFNIGSQLFYPYAPAFSLYSTFIRSSEGHYFAGYKPDDIVNSELALQDGIKHQYGIDINFNVSDLSPDEKLLYNPAEVDITALDLYFPSNYTFKTVRGVYPTLSEVALSIGAEGNYHDLRDVPVFTDLNDKDIDDYTNDNPTRSSRYYIKSDAKLTIEPCVTIYDAVFILQGNGELVFQDRESTYGRFEVFQENSQFGTQLFTDQQGNIANYKLIDKQGMVTPPVSLVPQGNTFLYESNDLIESGTAQQLPANLNLPITIAPETHVVFVAENEIKLTPGFHAAADHSPSSQSVFHALIWPSHCAGSGNRMMANNNSQNNYQPQKFLYPTNPVLQPNPSRQNSRLYFSILENSKVSVKLYNAMGQLVNTSLHQNMKEKGNHIVEIKTEGLQPGIYLCTLYTEVDGSKKPMQVSRKLVVEQ